MTMRTIKILSAIIVLVVAGPYLASAPLVIDGVRCGNYTGMNFYEKGAVGIKTEHCEFARCNAEYRSLIECLDK